MLLILIAYSPHPRSDFPSAIQYLLTGLIQKASSPGNSISLTDIYGTLLSSRLFVPDAPSIHETTVDPIQLSLHRFRRFVDNAQLPMPIFTAISRHLAEPLKELEEELDAGRRVSLGGWKRRQLNEAQKRIEGEARWMWL